MSYEQAANLQRQLEQSAQELVFAGRALAAKSQGAPQPLNIEAAERCALELCAHLQGLIKALAQLTAAQVNQSSSPSGSS